MQSVDIATARPARAAWSHLLALTGPIVPGLMWAAWRGNDPAGAREAAKASVFSLAMIGIFCVGTAVRIFVPLVGFLGTLTQWVVPIVAIYFCLAGFRLARQGQPAQYPIQFKVVKTHD